jgi:hypothetical protein
MSCRFDMKSASAARRALVIRSRSSSRGDSGRLRSSNVFFLRMVYPFRTSKRYSLILASGTTSIPHRPGNNPIADVIIDWESRVSEFAPDPPLEGYGFEPSVPRRMDGAFEDAFSRLRHFPFCERASPPGGDLGFESVSLRRRVRCELTSGVAIGSRSRCRAGGYSSTTVWNTRTRFEKWVRLRAPLGPTRLAFAAASGAPTQAHDKTACFDRQSGGSAALLCVSAIRANELFNAFVKFARTPWLPQ